MADRAIVKPETVPSSLSTLVADAEQFAADARAPNTRRVYASQLRTFESWCREQDLAAMPATPQTVALFITYRANQGRKVPTIEAAISAISEAHRLASKPDPTVHLIVREVLRGIRRRVGTAPNPKDPVIVETLRRIIDAMAGDKSIVVRDRALLAIGFFGALRRSELIGLNAEDIETVTEGLIVRIRKSKTDQDAKGAQIGIPYNSQTATCPVLLYLEWVKVRDAEGELPTEPAFVSINRWGRLGGRLDPKDVARIVKKGATLAGFDDSNIAGHSLRSGFATSAARARKPMHTIKRQGRWESSSSLDQYIRDVAIFEDSAADL